MHHLTHKQVSQFQEKILGWFTIHQRDLPWRRNRDPYHILLSEIMLQQTQVVRVIPKYEAWLKKWPTIKDLARATTADVLTMWSGLGYNRRAINLQRVAQLVILNVAKQSEGSSDVMGTTTMEDSSLVTQNDNTYFPSSIEQLRELPGIGEYTARAIACFAFNKQVAVVDTNVRKVIAVAFFNGEPPDAKTTQEVAGQLLPEGKAYQWNQALMDYAASELKKEKIPVAKQSNFKGSNRYYRGQIIKLLIKEGEITKSTIFDQFPEKESQFLEKIINELLKNHLVITSDNTVSLP